jgi:hypothetical protein
MRTYLGRGLVVLYVNITPEGELLPSAILLLLISHPARTRGLMRQMSFRTGHNVILRYPKSNKQAWARHGYQAYDTSLDEEYRTCSGCMMNRDSQMLTDVSRESSRSMIFVYYSVCITSVMSSPHMHTVQDPEIDRQASGRADSPSTSTLGGAVPN